MKKAIKVLVFFISSVVAFVLLKIYLVPVKQIDGKYLSDTKLFLLSIMIGFWGYMIMSLILSLYKKKDDQSYIDSNDYFDCTGGAGGIM